MLLFDDQPTLKQVEFPEAQERLRQIEVITPSCRWDKHLGEVPIENYDATRIARGIWVYLMDIQNSWEIAQGY